MDEGKLIVQLKDSTQMKINGIVEYKIVENLNAVRLKKANGRIMHINFDEVRYLAFEKFFVNEE